MRAGQQADGVFPRAWAHAVRALAEHALQLLVSNEAFEYSHNAWYLQLSDSDCHANEAVRASVRAWHTQFCLRSRAVSVTPAWRPYKTERVRSHGARRTCR